MNRDYAKARQELQNWERRLRFLAPLGRLANVGWRLLIQVYYDESTSRASVTSIIIGAKLRPTTGLRYVEQLIEHGYLKREYDRRDGRRIMLRLTPYAEWEIEAILSQVAQEMPHEPTFNKTHMRKSLAVLKQQIEHLEERLS